MYYTRSSKQLDSVSSLNLKTEKASLSKNDDVKKKVFSISGRPVLRSKNISNRKSLNQLEKNNKININEENKPGAAKTLSQLQKSKHKSLNKNQSCLPTVVNKENIINPNILKVFESNYKTNHVQVITEQETEPAVLKKRQEKRKSSINNKNEINTESIITKSKNDQNKSHADITVNKENANNLENKFSKSLNLNENIIPKHNPVWKTCPNDNQESKKRVIDVYDITEDEDLQKEGFHKKKKVYKQTKSKVKNPHRKINKNTVKQNQEKLPNKTILPICPNIQNANPVERLTTEKHNLQIKNENNAVETLEEVLIIDLKKQTNREVTFVKKDNQSDTKETFDEVTTIYTIDTEKQFHRPITPVKKTQPDAKKIPSEATVIQTNKQIHKTIVPDKKTQPDSKHILNETKVIDPSKQIHRETTPVRETQPDSEQTASLNCTDLDSHDKVLIPPMTSTPENDVFSPATQYVNLGNSFFARMSEIPAIPTITSNKEVDGLEDELLYSNKPTCSPVKISLFESPLKMDKLLEKPTGSNLKQTKLNAFVEHYTKASAERPEKDSFNLFDSPVKKNKGAKSLENIETSNQRVFSKKEKKPRKSYDNRDKIRVNIACWKKTCNKEKSVSEKKEEELVQSLNEYFSELENFELCID